MLCGDLRWFAVICGGLSFSHTVHKIQIIHNLHSHGPCHSLVEKMNEVSPDSRQVPG